MDVNPFNCSRATYIAYGPIPYSLPSTTADFQNMAHIAQYEKAKARDQQESESDIA